MRVGRGTAGQGCELLLVWGWGWDRGSSLDGAAIIVKPMIGSPRKGGQAGTSASFKDIVCSRVKIGMNVKKQKVWLC